MMNLRSVSLAVLALTLGMTGTAAAATDSIFGGRAATDGAINLRKSTTEQYNPVRGQSVAARPRPDFAPTPVTVGGFQLFPQAALQGVYDSNIYTTEANDTDDFTYSFQPQAYVTSNWGRHQVAFSAFGDVERHVENTSENNENFALQAEGRYDIAQKTFVGLSAGYQETTEPRGNPSNPGASAEPVDVAITTAGIDAYRGVGKLKAKAEYDYKLSNYSDPKLTAGGRLDQAGRDRQSNKVGGELKYEITQNLQPFVRASYEMRDYVSNPVRDSDGYNVVGGLALDLGGITTGEIYAGWLTRDYNDMTGGDVGVMDMGGNLLWNVTEITSIGVEASRTIDETTFGGTTTAAAASSITATGGSVAVTHEIMRNLIAEVEGQYTENEYNYSSREDDVWGVGAGTRYYINRNLSADLTYDYTRRDSNIAGRDYDKNLVMLRLGAQY